MMASQPLSGLLRLMHGHDPVCELADAELLSRFHADREQRAFTELVRRHGPMVFGVCRRVVGGSADADDAFQAVFVVLARRAGEIQKPELLGHWLYAVAYRIARKARRITVRKRNRETPLTTVPEPIDPFREIDSDLAPILDDELARLPEWYRTPIVLCDLHGLSRNETATRLGIPEGTLSSRLAKGRKKLADRLTRRGITLAILTSFFSEQLRADLPLPLLDSTVQSAIVVVMGGPLSATITQLASEGVFTMRKLFVVALGLSITSIGVVWATQKVDDPKTPPVAKAAIKKDEPKAEQPAKATVTWSKPRMVNYYDLPGPPEKLLWGASEKKPYLFVEWSLPAGTDRPVALDNRVAVIRPGDEKTVTETVLQRNHHLADVYKNESAFASVRFDVGGINSLRELRYFVSKIGLDDVNGNIGPPIVDPKTKQRMYTTNDFTPRLNLNEATKQAVPYTTFLDSDSLQHFQLTPDGKGVWNVFSQTTEQGEQTQSGLQLLDPVTSKVLKKLPAIPDTRYPSIQCNFDHDVKYAVAVTQSYKEEHDELVDNSSIVTCWDLTKGTVAWSLSPPKDLIATSVAIAADGKTVAIGYQILDIRRRSSPQRSGFEPKGGRKTAAQQQEEIDKRLEAFPEPRVHFHDTVSGKQTGEITLNRRMHDLRVQLSPHAELLLFQSTQLKVENFGRRNSYGIQVYDVASRKLVQSWDDVTAKFAFCPKNDGDAPILAIAEDVIKRGDQPNAVVDRTGRLGLWRFECSRVEEKK